MQWIYATLFVLLGSALSQELPEDLQKLKDKLASAITLEDAQGAVKGRCEKNGGPDAFDKLETAAGELAECIQSNFNRTVIEKEIEVKRKTGDLDEVFEKYCGRVPTVKQCVKTAAEAAQACMEDKEKESLKLLLNITDSLATFACYKDGDRIAMFIAEGGPKCIESRVEELQQCVNQTLSHRIPADFSINSLPAFDADDTEEACKDFGKLQTCAVQALEKCDDSTPANIIDALFKFIRRVSPCKDFPVS